jgi:hypothetical protein
MQRHTALAIPFRPGNLGATQSTRAVYPDAECTKTHGSLNSTLHRTAEGHTTNQLLGNALGNQLRIELGLADLDDVQMNIGGATLGDLAPKHLNRLTFLADHDSGTSRIDHHAGLLGRTLDHYTRDTGIRQPLFQILTDLDVFLQHFRVTGFREPTRIPGTIDADPQPDGINLLAHQDLPSLCSRTTIRRRL